MARNSMQLEAAIARERYIMETATSQQTRQYARERRDYLHGEWLLQKAKEEQEAIQLKVLGWAERSVWDDHWIK